MTNDAEQYYNAWTQTFHGQPQKLLCIWHVDRAWRKSLTKIADKKIQIDVYHTLRVLLDERDSDKFNKLLDNGLVRWKTDVRTVDFCTYFIREYSKSYKQWAQCYRKKACINTNMYLESFHRVLKYAYLKGTVNKRMVSTINMLLKYARDKLFDRLIKMEKGKNTSRLQTITKRHKSSLELPTSLVSPSSEQSVWNVKSATTHS